MRLAMIFVCSLILLMGCGGGTGGSTKLEGSWVESKPSPGGEPGEYAIKADGSYSAVVKVNGAKPLEWNGTWQKISDTKIMLKTKVNDGVAPAAELVDPNTMELDYGTMKRQFIRKK